MKKRSPKKKALKSPNKNTSNILSFFKKVETNAVQGASIKDEYNEIQIKVCDNAEQTEHTTKRSSELLRSPTKKRKCDISFTNTVDQSLKKKCNLSLPSTSNHRSPLKQIDVSIGAKDKNKCSTPEKSEKNVATKLKKSVSSPKLFQRTPQKIQDFNVDVLENYVKITPSKSNSSSESGHKTSSPNSAKVQTSIMKYVSPSTSNRSIEAQRHNEVTPRKQSPTKKLDTPVLKVKTRLNFEDTHSFNMKQQDLKVKSIRENELPESSKQKLPDEFCIEEFINSEFEEEYLVSPVEINELELTLDLSQSQHCAVTKLELFPSYYEAKVKSTVTGESAVCIMKDFWANLKLCVGDKIHIMAKKVNSQWQIDNQHGLMVYESDLLISSTSVVNSLFCKRKSVLSEKFQGFDCTNEYMVVGTLIHYILQETLRKKYNTIKQIEEATEKIITSKETIRRLYESNQSVDDIRTKISIYLPKILEFVDSYVQTKNKDPRKRQLKKNCWQGNIDTIEDIEENIWCPELGTKGKVDVSIKTGNNVMPLELKTGKASFSLEHKGQVLLYVMMMNKLGYKVSSGLLLYLRDGIVKEIPMSENEKRDIIILRNELAYYLKKRPSVKLNNSETEKRYVPAELPEPINHHNACRICPYNVICSAFLEYNGNELSNNAPLRKVKDEVLSHLKEEHLNYFIQWNTLLNLEEVSLKSGSKSIQEIYTFSPSERESKGRCISNLKISHVSDECNGLMNHTFLKEKKVDANFFASGISEGNYVVVSLDNRSAVVSGFVIHIDAHSITVSLDRDLRAKYSTQHFHIDTYDSTSGQAFNQTSLTLLLENSPKGEHLRQIIIEKRAPTFVNKLPKIVAVKGIPILKKLNKKQQRAVLKAISANDFLLIKGMPGTGKTATIVALIQLLNELGKTVLITSHTHSAVDNVCTKLARLGIDFLRLGSSTKINESLEKYSEAFKTKDCKTPEELSNIYDQAKVIASTCLGCGHPILSKKILDVCIVDESTQVLQPTIIRPLHSAKKFILIGDPEQLPPVVRNRDAIELGILDTLFDRLQSEEGTISLTLNYRMNKTITELANLLTYKGELLVANESVGNACLKLTDEATLSTSLKNQEWLLKILDTDLRKAVQLVDTGPVWNRNDTVSWSINEENVSLFNIHEAAVIENLVQALQKGGIKPEDIGIIAPYNFQVKQLSAILDQSIDVSTVDQFQGRDKDVIIYSCTKSTNSEGPTGKYDILEDHRRLNVAITRAKLKLILIGDMDTVKKYTPFRKLLIHSEKFEIMKLIENVDGFVWSSVLNNVKVI